MRYLIVLFMVVCSVCFAQNQLFIFFLNGVNTTPDEADANLSKLESIIPYNDNINWNILYNATHGVIRSDIWDVIRQKRAEKKNYNVKEYITRNPKSTLQDYLYDNSYVGKNLKDLVEQFHDRFPKDMKESYALIISHSQGNQYANQLFDYLVNGEGFPKDHIALFGVASPADRIERGVNINNLYYITADNDKIINMSRVLGNGALQSNVHIKDCNDFPCHNFINDYLGDNSIRSIICNQIGSYMNLWLNTQPIC